MVILAQTSNFQNCIKKTNKIPEYARDFKKEYLLIIGIEKMCFRFFQEYEIGYKKLFASRYSDRIRYFIKRFLKGQESGKLKDTTNLVLRKYDFSHIYRLYQDLVFDFENVQIRRPYKNKAFRDFYKLLSKFYKKVINVYDVVDDGEYMKPIEYNCKSYIEYFDSGSDSDDSGRDSDDIYSDYIYV